MCEPVKIIQIKSVNSNYKSPYIDYMASTTHLSKKWNDTTDNGRMRDTGNIILSKETS